MELRKYSHRSGSFDDMMLVGDQLSKSERLHVFGTDKPKDWTDYGGKVIYREVYYRGTTPVGFVAAYEYDRKEPGRAYVVTAVVESERRSGLATDMFRDCMDAFSKDPKLRRYSLNAVVDRDNDKSPGLIKKAGFIDVTHRDGYDPKHQRVMELPKAGSESITRDPIMAMQNYAVPFRIISGTSHDVKGVVDSLSKKELHFICPQSKHWVESPFKDLRYIAKAENGDVMGFVDGYCFPDDLDTVVLVIAVKKQYRGTGAADQLLQKVIDYCRRYHKKIFFRIDKNNAASVAFFNRYHPKLIRTTEDQYVYEMTVA